MSQRSVPREIPPGMVDGFCTRCQAEVLVRASDRRCLDCGAEVHPLSLPSVPQEVREAERRGRERAEEPARPLLVLSSARPTAPASGLKPSEDGELKRAVQVTLTGSREALAWDTATDALVERLAREEAEASAAYEAAAAHLKRVRRELAAVKQVRAVMAVEPTASALAAPASVEQAGRAPKRNKDGRWARDHDGCVTCGRDDSPHSGRGQCSRCAQRRRAGAKRGQGDPR